MSLVLVESLSKQVTKITLNDPDALNAMGEDMAVEFSAAVEKLKVDSALRAIILTGAGRAFSAGGHLEMLKKKSELSGEENRKRMLGYYNSFLSILKLNIPVIVAINGHAIGAGLCLAAACDIRIAAQGAKLGLTFTKLGLHPGMGATYTFSNLIGPGNARELMLTSRVINAEESLRIGLVSKVVPDGESVKAAEAVAAEIMNCGPEATKQLLESLRRGAPSLEFALEREAMAQSVNYANAEFKEGVNAAIEKRPAKF